MRATAETGNVKIVLEGPAPEIGAVIAALPDLSRPAVPRTPRASDRLEQARAAYAANPGIAAAGLAEQTGFSVRHCRNLLRQWRGDAPPLRRVK